VLLACSVQALYIFGTEKCPEFIEGQIKKTHLGLILFSTRRVVVLLKEIFPLAPSDPMKSLMPRSN